MSHVLQERRQLSDQCIPPSAHLENRRGLEHLGHECGHAAQLTVAGPDARQDFVAHGDLGLGAGHKASDLKNKVAKRARCRRNENGDVRDSKERLLLKTEGTRVVSIIDPHEEESGCCSVDARASTT